MSKRREKNKPQQPQTASLQSPAENNDTLKERHPIAKKMGDFFIDVAKLVIGGVILAGLMKQDIDYWLLVGSGSFAVLMFVSFGLYLIKYANKK